MRTRAAQAVLAYYGKNIRESKLIDLSKTDENEGTYLKEIVAFFHLKELSTNKKQNLTAVELFRYIDKDIPVILLIEAWGGGDTEFKYRCHDYGEGETKTYPLGIAAFGREAKFLHKKNCKD